MPDSLKPAAEIGLVTALWVILFWAIVRTRRRGASRSTEATITWLGSYTVAFQRALDICAAMEVELLEADPNHGIIVGRASLAGVGVGPTIRIALRTQEGVTTVSLTSNSNVVDVGLASRLTKRFVEIWDRMPEPAPSEPR